MQEGNDSIIDILRREPEQTDFLLKFGIGAPVLIVAWNWVASFFIANIFVVPTTLVLVLVYGGALVYLISRLVHQADRWQVESAMQARRLLTGSSRPAPRPLGDDDSVTPPPLPQVNFHQVAFFLNVQEEVLRARRDGRAMSVLALDITPPHGELTLEIQDKISSEMAHIVTSQAKVLSHWLSVGPTEFVFSLPNADHGAAKDFVSKLVQALGDYWCHYGLAVYPDEGTDAESLVLRAREQCEESRRDKGRGHTRVSAAYAS